MIVLMTLMLVMLLTEQLAAEALNLVMIANLITLYLTLMKMLMKTQSRAGHLRLRRLLLKMTQPPLRKFLM